MHSLSAASYLYVEIPDLMYNNDNQTTYSANYSNVNVIWHIIILQRILAYEYSSVYGKRVR